MQRTRWKHKAASVLGALAVAAGVSGIAVDARALEFANGDLVLAMFGNGQEYYRNLGPASTVLAGPQVDIDLSTNPLNPMTVTAGGFPVRWTLLSGQGTTQLNTFINIASTQTAAEIIASESNNGVSAAKAGIDGWRNFLLTNTGPGSEVVLDSTNPASFTSNFGIGGTLGGTWTGGGLQGLFDDTLTIVMGQARVGAEFNVLSDVGRAVLASNGLLSICGGAGCSVAAVPIPAAVVLFGSGLVGLAGIARRSFIKPTV